MHQINSVLILPISLQRMASSDMTGNHHLHGVSLIRNLPVRYILIYYIPFIQPCPKRGERFPARLYLYARHSFFFLIALKSALQVRNP